MFVDVLLKEEDLAVEEIVKSVMKSEEAHLADLNDERQVWARSKENSPMELTRYRSRSMILNKLDSV